MFLKDRIRSPHIDPAAPFQTHSKPCHRPPQLSRENRPTDKKMDHSQESAAHTFRPLPAPPQVHKSEKPSPWANSRPTSTAEAARRHLNVSSGRPVRRLARSRPPRYSRAKFVCADRTGAKIQSRRRKIQSAPATAKAAGKYRQCRHAARSRLLT